VCYGSGTMMGGGMMQRNCDHCDGTGKVVKQIDEVLAKDTVAYKETIAKIKETDTSITDEQADKIFTDEFAKIKRGRGRPKRGSNDTSRWQAN